jgi:hypothetical protein
VQMCVFQLPCRVTQGDTQSGVIPPATVLLSYVALGGGAASGGGAAAPGWGGLTVSQHALLLLGSAQVLRHAGVMTLDRGGGGGGARRPPTHSCVLQHLCACTAPNLHSGNCSAVALGSINPRAGYNAELTLPLPLSHCCWVCWKCGVARQETCCMTP